MFLLSFDHVHHQSQVLGSDPATTLPSWCSAWKLPRSLGTIPDERFRRTVSSCPATLGGPPSQRSRASPMLFDKHRGTSVNVHLLTSARENSSAGLRITLRKSDSEIVPLELQDCGNRSGTLDKYYRETVIFTSTRHLLPFWTWRVIASSSRHTIGASHVPSCAFLGRHTICRRIPS